MKEHPILFSCPMVEAIRLGIKTQTRRVIMPQPVPHPDHASVYHNNEWLWKSPSGKSGIYRPERFTCPYGQCGDMLWVRETWSFARPKSTGDCNMTVQLCGPSKGNYIVYRAGFPGACMGRWRPSIHMPRWASRITLSITDVRVERLNEFTQEDAKAEGFCTRNDFIALWDKLNKKRGYGWDANPWVWVVKFKEVK